MNIAAEFKAAMPEPHTVLGLRLLPLSIGRYRLLKRFNSPFVSEDDVEMSLNSIVGELVFALIVCGLRCDEFENLIDTGKIEKECRRFNKNFVRLVKKTKGFNLFEHVEKFKSYISESTDLPWVVVQNSEPSGESASHWSHGIEVTLRSEVGWTPEEIEEKPLAKGLCDYFKHLEMHGSVTLVSHEDHAIMESFGNENAKILMAFEQSAKEAKN